jgi:hypothetical protein
MSKHTQRKKQKREKQNITLARNERIISGKPVPLNLYSFIDVMRLRPGLHVAVMDYAHAVKKGHDHEDAVMYAWLRAFGEPP